MLQTNFFKITALTGLVLFTATAQAELYPTGDLNQDYGVDIEDALIFADQWMDESGCVPPNCAELDGFDRVTLGDFSILSDNWLVRYQLPLTINEFMASNNDAGGVPDPQGDYDDWIEIYNYGDTTIDVGGMYLSDDIDNPTKWQFPTDRPGETTLPSGDFLVVWADEDVADIPGLHADFQLSSDGEEVALFDTDGQTLIDSIFFGDQITNISYGRWPDSNDDLRYFATATPGDTNSDAYLGAVEDTKFSHNRGFYDSSFNLTITCATPGATIYYTTDGSAPIENETPTAASIPYSNPISISSNKCIRAGAIKTGWLPTNIDTHTYIFDATDTIKSLPIYSIVGDPDKTFWGSNGILPNATQRGELWERPVSFEILDPQTGDNVQIDCGIRVAGSNYHRPLYTIGNDWDSIEWYADGAGNNHANYNYNKFSFKLFFRSEYGDNELEYPLFPLADTDTFKAFQLRAGHNDSHNPFIKDELLRRLHQDMGGVAVTGTLVNFYLNGEYKSFYNPCERLDHDFFRDYYDVDTDWDVITNRAARNGDYTAWNAAQNYVRNTDLTNTASYAKAGEMIDIVDFIDYLIVQLYSANWDWPSNNWVVSHERTPEGKFRFHCWDMELTMETDIDLYNFGFDDYPRWGPGGLNSLGTPLGYIYRGLKTNPEFRVLFADRIQKHFFYDGALTQAHIAQRFNELRQEMAMELPDMDLTTIATWVPQRHQIMLDKFTDEDLFPSQGPDFKVNGVSQHGGYVVPSDTITITAAGPSNTIYYTTDGSDPRTGASIITSEGFTVFEDAAKRVFVPTGNIGTAWRGGSEPYDDSGWTDGAGGVGYERSSGYESAIDIDTQVPMYNTATSCYIRIPFTVDSETLSSCNTLLLKIRYDDGLAAYLNGMEVARVNFSGTPEWNSHADNDSHESSHANPAPWDVTIDISDHLDELQAGDNMLAIHGMNANTTSSDFLICAELEGLNITEIIPSLSPGAIAYTGAFQLNQSTEIKSRVLLPSGEWSALHEVPYGVGPVAESLRVSEIMYHPPDPNDEFIELINTGSTAINLNRVRLTKGVDFTFGAETLSPDERILLVRDQASFLNRYPAFNGRIAGEYEGALDNGGDKIRVRDGADMVIQEFTYKDGWYAITDGEGFSLTIRNAYSSDPNDWDTKDGWRPSAAVGGSPGQDDAGILPDPGSIVINEILAHSHDMQPDWIELYNTTNTTINIGGWFLSDSNADEPNMIKYEIPVGTAIDAYDFVVFYEHQHFGNPQAPGTHTPFALSEGGETVYLRSGSGGVIGGYETSEDFGASATGIAFGRYIKSVLDGGINFVPMSVNTPRMENAYPQVGPVVISEIMYNTDATNLGDEYIELHNITGASVTLQDSVSTETSPGTFITDVVTWRFSDGIDFDFPADTTIPPYGYLVIASNPTAFTDYYGAMPAGVDVLGPFQNDTALSNGGERVQIVRPGDQEYGQQRYWIRTERVTYDDDPPWPDSADGDGDALHQKTPDTQGANYGNDVINWQAASPTPGQ